MSSQFGIRTAETWMCRTTTTIQWREAVEGMSSKHKLLFDMLKRNISDALGHKLKEH
jgi:hypothetical protein